MSIAAEIAQSYTPTAKPNSKGVYKINCPNPSHPDANPSCEVYDLPDGTVKIRCYVCGDTSGWHAICDDIKGRGLPDPRVIWAKRHDPDGLNKERKPRGSSNPKPKTVQTHKKRKEVKTYKVLPTYNVVENYDYQKLDGSLSYTKQRKFDKGKKYFVQFGYDAQTKLWRDNKDGIESVLWRLPKVRETAVGGGIILLCEGEKDVLTVEKLTEGQFPPGEFCATTSDTSSFWPDQHTEAVKGASCVYIFPDNDPAGEKHLNKVGPLLIAAGIDAQVVRLPGLKEKGDISDWIEAGHTFDDLFVELGNAVPYEMPQEEEKQTDQSEAEKPVNELQKKREEKGIALDGQGQPLFRNEFHRQAIEMLGVGMEPAGDHANGQRLINFTKGDLKWAVEGVWCRYHDGLWRQTDEKQVEVFGLAQKVMPTIADEARSLLHVDETLHKEMTKFAKVCNTKHVYVKTMVEAAKPLAMCSIKDFDTHKNLVNLNNVIVDLRTAKPSPHNRDMMFMKKINIDYNPNADSPEWREVLEQIFDGDYEKIAFLQRFAGYSMTGETKEQKALFLHGPGGNGKGVVSNSLLRVFQDLGTLARKDMFMQTHLKDHSDNASILLGKRLVCVSETERKDRLNQGFFKDVTGGDRIRGRFMRCESFEYFPECKLWFSTNFLPRIDDTTESVWRRILVLKFDHIFETPDVNLIERLSTPENQQGILKWVIDGSKSYNEDGLCIPSVIINDTKAYRGEEDKLGRYMEECVEFGPDYFCSIADFFEDWSAWCKASNSYPGELNGFAKDLKNRIERERLPVEYERTTTERGYRGMIPRQVKEKQANRSYLNKRIEKDDED